MSTVLGSPVFAQTTPAARSRTLLSGVSWDTYRRLNDEVEHRPGQRMLYGQGLLEIMATSWLHERLKKLIAQVIELLCFDRGIRKCSGGSLTLVRGDLQRGLEPDECYWIQHEADVRNKLRIDLSVDPPPDLAVEVDVTASVDQRLPIYAALGLPEIWNHDTDRLRVLLLGDDGMYRESVGSAAFPFLPLGELAGFLVVDDERDESTQLQCFARWLGAQHADPAD